MERSGDGILPTRDNLLVTSIWQMIKVEKEMSLTANPLVFRSSRFFFFLFSPFSVSFNRKLVVCACSGCTLFFEHVQCSGRHLPITVVSAISFAACAAAAAGPHCNISDNDNDDAISCRFSSKFK